jgi:hypothetical protein
MRTLLILFLLFSVSPVEAQVRKTRLDGVLSNTELNATQEEELHQYLKGLKSNRHRHVRNDYVNDYDKGTVRYRGDRAKNMKGRMVNRSSNYAFHKVDIQDGTTIRGVIFAQKEPQTVISTAENLTFIDCNMNNVKKQPTWTYIRSTHHQIRTRVISDVDNGDGTFDLTIRKMRGRKGNFTEMVRETRTVDATQREELLERYSND